MALLSGFRVDVSRSAEIVSRLIDVTLPLPPPPVVEPPPKPKPEKQHHAAPNAAAPPPKAANPGGSPGPAPHGRAVIAQVAVRPTPAPAAGGGRGTGASQGAGSGGGTGMGGTGEDEGGTDLEHIAGEILVSDYPKNLAMAGLGGRVSVTFTVEVNGRATGCHVTRSSRVPELDALTCRIIEQRFRFRPSTDRYGRPIRDEVDWDHDWIPPRR